jgi:hypothetical protein
MTGVLAESSGTFPTMIDGRLATGFTNATNQKSVNSIREPTRHRS